jgi:hypothetical protein
MKVYVNSKKLNEPRQLVEAKLIKETKTTVTVELSDGHIIVRKKLRDLPKNENL